MKNYELTCLISPDVSEQGLSDLEQKIVSLIQERKGVLNESKKSIKTNLAYPLKGKKAAWINVIDFHLDPDQIPELNEKLKSIPDILRYLVSIKISFKAARFPSTALSKPKIAKKIKKAKPSKVELKEIEEKLEEILKQ